MVVPWVRISATRPATSALSLSVEAERVAATVLVPLLVPFAGHSGDELGASVAGEDQMRVGVDEARDQRPPRSTCRSAGGRRVRGSDPGDPLLVHDDRRSALDAQAVRTGAVARDELADAGDEGAAHGSSSSRAGIANRGDRTQSMLAVLDRFGHRQPDIAGTGGVDQLVGSAANRPDRVGGHHDEVGQAPSAMRPPSQPRLSYPAELAAATRSSEVNRTRSWLCSR